METTNTRRVELAPPKFRKLRHKTPRATEAKQKKAGIAFLADNKKKSTAQKKALTGLLFFSIYKFLEIKIVNEIRSHHQETTETKNEAVIFF